MKRLQGTDAGSERSFRRVAGRLGRAYGDGVSPEDAVQEAWVRAWLHGATGTAIGSWEAWVGTVAANLLRSEWRRRQAEARALARYAAPGPRAVVPEPHDEVHEALRGLPRRQREVVVLHYYHDLDVRGIAVRLGVAEGTVKSALHQARAALRARLSTHREAMHMSVWHMAGDHPEQYGHEYVANAYKGRRAARLWFRAREPKGFGTLMQSFMADRYVGKRVRFSAMLRTKGADDSAGLWMRVDGRDDRMLAFDNMEDRALSGTVDWTPQAIVLDVAEEQSRELHFGLLLSGRGEVWMADLRFEEVGPDVALTGRQARFAPADLDFANGSGSPTLT